MNTAQDQQHTRRHTHAAEAVFLSMPGALVTSRWIAIGDHTFATGDVDKAFIRTNDNRIAALGCAAAALAASFLYVPVALPLITGAVLFALRGALRPRLQLVLHARSQNTVVLEAASSTGKNPDPETVRRVHGAIACAIGVSAAPDGASPVEGVR
jgi:hypothetical protein